MKQSNENNLHNMEELLATSGGSDDRLIQLGQQIGAESLLQVLDTLGGALGELHHIPSAEHFIAAKKRELRNTDVRTQLLAGVDPQLMAEKYRLSTKYIEQIGMA